MDPLAALLLFVLIPLVTIAGCVLFKYGQLRRKQLPTTLAYCLFVFVLKNAFSIMILTTTLSVLLCVNQAYYIAEHLQFGDDINYYLKVDLPAFDAISAINSAQAADSFNYVLTQDADLYNQIDQFRQYTGSVYSSTLRLMSGMTTTESARYYERSQQQQHRQLSTGGGTVSFIYHISGFSNLLTETTLQQVCLMEQWALANVACLATDNLKSILSTVFNTTDCSYLIPFQDALNVFSDSDNSAYVQDYVDPDAPKTAVVLSYLELGYCLQEYTIQQFQTQLNDYSSSSGVEISFVSGKTVSDEFVNAILNTLQLSAISAVVCFVFYIIAIRGVVCAAVTVYAIAVAVVNAAALLPLWNYQSFSVFNVMSVFILLGVGANSVLLFSSSWSSIVPMNTPVQAAMFKEVYEKTSKATLFTTLAACLSLFSKLASPVVVISQLGAFMGVAVLVFYVCLHFLIVPAWLLTSRLLLPLCLFQPLRQLLQCCGPVGRLCGILPASDNSDNNNNKHYTKNNSSDEEEQADSEVYTMHANPLLTTATAKISTSVTSSGQYVRGWLHQDASKCSQRLHNDSLHRSILVSNNDENDDQAVTVRPGHAKTGGDVQIDNRCSSSSSTIAAYTTTTNKSTRSCCSLNHYRRSIVRVKLLGVLALTCSVVIIALAAVLVQQRYVLNFGIPQLFEPTSNLGQVLTIAQHYKSTILHTASLSSIDLANLNTYSPTTAPATAPTPYYPTMAPNSNNNAYSPTQSPHAPTYQPTLPPYTSRPTSSSGTATNMPSTLLDNTMPPTTSTGTSASSQGYTDYSIMACWGISYNKPYIDSMVQPTYNAATFLPYVESGGIVQDMQELCQLVEQNRDYLNVNPRWNATRDCIYHQYQQVANSNFIASLPRSQQSVTNTLLYWASGSYTTGNLLGVEIHNNAYSLTGLLPLFLCSNYSLRTYAANLLTEPQLVVNVQARWSDLMTHASSESQYFGVATMVGSSEFTFPLLASEVLSSIVIALVVSTVGFVGLVALFTRDLALTLCGTIGMMTILLVSVCCHVLFCDTEVDLLDVVVLVAVVGMLVDFPIHLIVHFDDARRRSKFYKRRFAESHQLKHNKNSSSIASSASPVKNISAAIDTVKTTATTATADRADPTSVQALRASTSYLRVALIAPMLFSVVAGVPLLYAQLQLLKKTGQYVVILSMVSFLVTAFVLPYTLVVGCQLQWRKFCCYFSGSGAGIYERLSDEVDTNRVDATEASTVELVQPSHHSGLMSSTGGSNGNNNNQNDTSSSTRDTGVSPLHARHESKIEMCETASTSSTKNNTSN